MLLIAAAGFGVFWAGWRGKLVDTHPRCRKCSYDLTNRPEDQQRCPECGAWITAAHAIRCGTYQRRPRLMLIGLFAMLVGVFWAVLSFQVALGKLEPNDYLPISWQTRDIWADEQAAALFLKRVQARRFSAKQLAGLVDQILDRQANPKVVWRRSWGDIVETAHRSQLLDKPRWERYSRQAMPVEIRIRPAVRRGDPIPVEAAFGEIRVGQANSPWVEWWCVLEHKDTQTRVRVPSLSFMQYGYRLGWAPAQHLELLPTDTPAWAAVSPGPQNISIVQTMSLSQRGRDTATFAVDKTVQMLPPDQPTARPIDRPDLRETIEAGTTANMDRYGRIEVHLRRVPVDLAFDVALRWGEAEWPLGQLTVSKAGRQKETKHRFDRELPFLNAHRVHIVLRPSLAAAVATVDMTEFWNGEEIVQEMAWTAE